jgi:hypothetical protein
VPWAGLNGFQPNRHGVAAYFSPTATPWVMGENPDRGLKGQVNNLTDISSTLTLC